MMIFFPEKLTVTLKMATILSNTPICSLLGFTFYFPNYLLQQYYIKYTIILNAHNKNTDVRIFDNCMIFRKCCNYFNSAVATCFKQVVLFQYNTFVFTREHRCVTLAYSDELKL